MSDLETAEPNADLAYRVLNYIETHPDAHDQADFIRLPDSEGALEVSAENMPCGTTACFAGWTVLLSGHSIDTSARTDAVELDGQLLDVDDAASRLLGLGSYAQQDEQAWELFYGAATLDEVRRAVRRIFGPRP